VIPWNRKLTKSTELSRHGQYKEIRVITRDPDSDNCKLLVTLPRVTLSTGAPDDEDSLRKALANVTHAFVNTNSFTMGMKAEIYWGMRIYELCAQAGVKHFIWSSLDNFRLETGYDDSVRAGHYYGKGYVEQWLSAIPQRENGTRWSVLTTGPYVEMLSELFCPKKDDQGVYVFQMPLDDGAIPFVHLDDLGPYVHWIFDNPDESIGLNLRVAIEHVPLELIPAAFTKVTGKPARAKNLTLDEYFKVGGFATIADKKIGFEPAGYNDTTLFTYRQNFSNWFRIYQRSGGNKGILRRDYAFLDKVLPTRVASLEQWMRKVGYTGEPKPVLKNFAARQREAAAGAPKV
jgi:hypothetical protein